MDEWIRLEQHSVSLHGFGDILRLMLANITELQWNVAIYLLKDVRGNADTARLCNRLQPRCDVDPVSVDSSVVMSNNVTEVDADAKLHASMLGELTVAPRKLSLYFGRTFDCFDWAIEYRQYTITGSIDYVPFMS
jgi:hypothetical protein